MLLRSLVALLLCLAFSSASAAKAPQPQIGDVPPADLGKEFGGDVIDLGNYRGKVVIVTFWASWCGPCRKELPVLAHFQDTVGRDALEVIAVNYKESRRDFLGLLRANRDLQLTWVLDERGRISDRYGVESLPNMFIIDHDGRVVGSHRGYSEQMLPRIVDEIMSVLPPEVLSRPAGKGG